MQSFLQDIWRFWLETWRLNKTLFFVETFGTLTGMGAASVMAFQAPEPNLYIVFFLYVVSGLLLMYSNFYRRSSWMVMLMGYYTFVTTIGIIKLFI